MAVRVYAKNSTSKVAPDFEAREFDCPCERPECTETRIDDGLAAKLQEMRVELGCHVHIDRGGGCRCQWYEENLCLRGFRTAKFRLSQHIFGKAADISTGKHTGVQLEAVARKLGFHAVGVAKDWIHVDTRDDRDRTWTY